MGITMWSGISARLTVGSKLNCQGLRIYQVADNTSTTPLTGGFDSIDPSQNFYIETIVGPSGNESDITYFYVGENASLNLCNSLLARLNL
jgi:hypothetical protein